LGGVIAALNRTSDFETRLNGLLCRFHLVFKLVETAAQEKQENPLQNVPKT
jgi:hypothetical protein